MPRLPRLDLVGYPQHVIQRGNNRNVCFVSDEDYVAYAHWLREASEKYQVAIHAWVFMTNHVHLLVTPRVVGGVSKMMQSLGRRYVRYFNRVYGRTGTLWEGRFKSCLIDSERYLLECYRYIELNPVRANMVDEPSAYRWSSYCVNGLGKDSKLCTPHREYLALGCDKASRLTAYRELFQTQVSPQLIDDLRKVTQHGLVLGRSDFIEQIEALTKRKLTLPRLGRPLKNSVKDVSFF